MDHQIDMTGMNNSILAADNEGTGTEFLWGFLMGLLLGVFMLLMVSHALVFGPNVAAFSRWPLTHTWNCLPCARPVIG